MTSNRYPAMAIGLHWLIAAMILIAVVVGFTMTSMAFSPDKLKLINWHKWAGVTIFALVAVRLMWRATHTVPPMPASMPPWQQYAASGTHVLLYGLMVAIPLTGWLMSSAKGFQTVYFGVLPIPDLLNKDKALGETLEQVHTLLNYAMIAVVVAHALAALKHHFIDKDDVLRRMLPGHPA